ncbi:MAG: PEP-CTERM sorting domain-containing protein [Candidatus Zixiibacteriota bacterium]
MMIYRRETKSNARWLMALILFIAVMTFTVDEAFGLPSPARPSSNTFAPSGNTSSNSPSSYGYSSPLCYDDCQSGPEPTPGAVPEPTTLILFGLGLAAAGAARRKAN